VEPLDVVANITNVQAQAEFDRLAYTQLVARDLFNFLQSFATVTPAGERLVLPTDAVDRWMRRFTEKFARDPNFLLKYAGGGGGAGGTGM
jgi:hypothetical protein